MRLQKLELRNFCQHANLDVEFNGSLYGIVGPNGSGKSNLLNAVYFALTGESTSPGIKLDNVRAGTPENEPAHVKLWFEHNGVLGELTRHVRQGPRSKLMLGGTKIDGERQVTSTIMELLGVDVAMLRQLVVVSQDDLYGVLAAQPAVRAKLYQRLFQTTRAQQIYASLREAELKLQDDSPQVTVDTAALLQQAQQTVIGRQQQLSGCAPADFLRQQYTLATEEAAKHKATMEDCIRRESALRKKAELQQELQVKQPQQEAAAYQAPGLQQEQQDAEQQIAQLQTAIQNYQQAQAMRARLAQAQQALEKQRQLLEQLAVPIPAPTLVVAGRTIDDAAYAELYPQLHQQHSRLVSLETLMAQQNKVDGECPLCHTPASVIGDRIQHAWDEHATLKRQYEDLSYALVAWNNYKAQVTAQQDKVRHVEAGIQQQSSFVSTLTASCESLPAEQYDVAQLTTQIEAAREKVRLCKQQLTYISELTTAVNNIKWQLETLNSDPVLNLTMDVATAQARMLQAKELADVAMQQMQARAALEQQLTAEQAQLTIAMRNHELAQTQYLKRQQDAAALDRIRKLMEVYHYDAAPKVVTQRNLEICATRLNSVLSAFGAKFSAQVNEDLSFNCVFPDKVQPAERLSCGQRVVLALCLRIALVTALLPDVGLLLLDEPTTFLDADTIKAFNNALQQLREFAAVSNIQVILVTHCTDLIPAFDGVVQL